MPDGRRAPRFVAAAGILWIGSALACNARGQGPATTTAATSPAAAKSAPVRLIRQGTPRPGKQVVIGPDEPAARGTSYRWTQVEGPKVQIDDPTTPRIRFTVPPEARRLSFLLAMRDETGERSLSVPVPIGPSEASPGDGAAPSARGERIPEAEAGDDRAGVVGQEVVLDGARSRPGGRLGYRWLQVSGPTLPEMASDGPRLAFVPTVPGAYRFALLVGLDSRVSKPDFVAVTVAPPPPSQAAPPSTVAETKPAPPSPLAAWFASAVATIPRGAETADQVADVLDSVARRAPLYTSYSQLQSELTRRLDVVVPSDPALRDAWAERVFSPLSQLTAAELLAAGIDLRAPSAADRPLDDAQKDRLQTLYRGLADACRPRSMKP